MIRRTALVVGALIGALTLSSCSTFTSNDDAARVGDTALSQHDLALMLDSQLGQSLLGDAPIGGLVPGTSARRLIGLWAAVTAIDQAGFVDPATTGTIEADLAETYGDAWTQAPDVLRRTQITYVAITTLLDNGELDQETATLAVRSADIAVDSRYGVWQDDQFAVVPLG